jgi:crotonobetainyl-CoA:carnitine CoA-transferase CaiB-like acyl-CoA transferase
MSYDAPFAGLKVIDLSQGVAGPYCGMLLAQHGANVIKVEPTGDGDWARTLAGATAATAPYSIPANLGKRSIALDLKSDAGKDVLWRLIAGADVLLEGFRPGVLDRLGFGYAAVSEREPRILYLSVSGFGQTGPLLRPAGDGPGAAGLHRPDDRQQGRGRHPASRAVRRDRHVDRTVCVPGALGCPLRAPRRAARAAHRGQPPADGERHAGDPNDDGVSGRGAGAARHAERRLQDAQTDGCNSWSVRNDAWIKFCSLLGAPELATDPRFINEDARMHNETD